MKKQTNKKTSISSLLQTKSKSILTQSGKIILYSTDDFYKRIVIENDCFICGAIKGSKTFNDEHILPNWLLNKYKLHSKSITLSNGAKFNYGNYTISCCAECNTDLGQQIEKPISELLKLSYSEICKAVTTDQKKIQLLFKWLLLIFFKTHLKDTEFRWNLDKRKSEEKISDGYQWEKMHHIHCMVRKSYTNAIVDSSTIGSIIILPAIQHSSIEPFDFTDNFNGKTIMLRLDEFCIICVLDDSCGAYSMFIKDLAKITGPCSPFQLREILSHMTYINLHLKERPSYYSSFSPNGKYYIKATVPKNVELIEEKDRQITFGEIMHYYIKDMIRKDVTTESVLNQIMAGKYTYLFDNNGNFKDYRTLLKAENNAK